MDMDEYQLRAKATAKYPQDRAMEYLGLQNASEAGETAGKLAKAIRGDYDKSGLAGAFQYDALRDDIKKELGDQLWYISEIARQFGLSLSEVAQANLNKLQDRATRGVIKGSGDNR